jgi:hypothetical protein
LSVGEKIRRKKLLTNVNLNTSNGWHSLPVSCGGERGTTFHLVRSAAATTRV